MSGLNLSIIIVNWNSKNYLGKCLETLFAQTGQLEFEVIVIDGGSFDGCGPMLTEHFPQVRFIQSKDNLGFGKANNEAYKISKGRSILFLNPDTDAEQDAIVKLLNYLESIPKAGIVGAKLLNSDRSVQTSCVRAFPTINNQIIDAEELRRRFPRSRLWGTAPLFDGTTRPVQVQAISGACLMIKRSVFEKVDKFSNDYFMYSEDVDLCYKALKAGWKTYYVPAATIIHHGGGSSSSSNFSTFSNIMMMESRWRFFKKTRSNGYANLFRLAVFMVAIVRTGLMLAISPVAIVQGKVSSFKLSVGKWIKIMRWAVGLEKWVKSH